MNVDERLLEKVLADLRASSSGEIARHENVFSTGLTMSSGRAVGVVVEAALTFYRVSDAGEAWSDLVMSGYADPRPSVQEREKLQRACELYGASWDIERREIFTLARSSSEIAQAAGRIAAATIAIDGWRAWYPPRQTRDVNRRRIVDHVTRLAPVRGWSVDITKTLRGKVHTWPADATLVRNKRRAALEITAERRGEHVMQRIIGFLYDVSTTGLVVVVSREVDEYIRGSAELRERVVVVPRLRQGTPRAIVEAAERAAVEAA